MSQESMTNPAESPRTLVIERVFPHPPEKLWRALTESPLLAQWMMNNDFEPVVGRRFQFRADPMPNWNGVVDCEVLVVDPLQRLSYNWGVGGSESGLQWVVLWTLTPAEGGTHVRMEQSGFRPDQQASLSGCKLRLAEVLRRSGACARGVGMTMKAKNITYWTTTILIAFFIGSGGVAQMAQYPCQPPWRRARPWLPNVLLCHPGILEGAWSHCHTCAALSAAQGMGVCRHLLRPDRRGRILRCGRRLRRLRVSCHRPSHPYWSYGGIVGAATPKPYHRRPLSCGINTGLSKLK